MIKKITHLAIVAVVALSCSTAFGQNFTFINPLLDLQIPTGGSGPFTTTFDISNELGFAAPGSVTLEVDNGFTNEFSGNSSFTVSDTEETTFTLGGTVPVLAQVSHGSFLGAPNFINGSQARDGVRSPTEFSLVSQLETGYQFGSTADLDPNTVAGGNFFVDFLPNTGVLEQNQIAGVPQNFLFQSADPISNFTVFSNNTTDLNNNFSVGFAVASVPEPASGLLLVFATGLIGLRRNRRS